MSKRPEIDVCRADLCLPEHAEALLALLDAYARDPMGGGTPLPDSVRDRLIDGLLAHPTTLVFLAKLDGEFVGLANCFVGFSTFAAKPLINLHDVTVHPRVRGRGIGRALLAAVEAHARQAGYCKLTLEVLENNQPARGLYESFGFRQATYGAKENGGTLFYSKTLADVS